MLNKNCLKDLLSKMTEDTNSNLKKIKKAFGNLEYRDEDNQTLLHIFVDDKYDETKCFLAIKSLLQIGLNPNLEADYNYNFIQTALYAGYSEEFILKIINEALKYNLNVNHVDSDKDTIVHTAIYSDDYLGEVERIYELLCTNGFDSSARDYTSRNLVEAMIFQKQYSEAQIKRFKSKFDTRILSLEAQRKNNQGEIKPSNVITSPKKQQVTVDIVKPLSEKDLLELEKYGNVLNKKNYLVAPTIGREKELKNLMITLAQDKKRPLLVGEAGVGKTSIVDELAYRITTGQVPNFLQNKIILEINPSDHIELFEDNMTKLITFCERHDVIVFIDEIHRIYGIDSAEYQSDDLAAMLKYYIARSNLKIIGTTTEQGYNELLGIDIFKRKFEKVIVKEPTEDVLYQIINKVIEDYCVKSGITFENENMRNQIVNILLEATEKSHRVYYDIVNNPELAISIVDKAFAFAKVYDSEYITQDHFIESVKSCDRLYNATRKQVISRLRSLDVKLSKPASKVLKINFNKFRKQ